MVPVTVDYIATAGCPTTCTLDVVSNERINGLGDGNTSPDWEVVDAHHVNLRSERSGLGTGRIYPITINCTNAAGTSTSAVLVSVPRDQP
jgi:hypothetical protein